MGGYCTYGVSPATPFNYSLLSLLFELGDSFSKSALPDLLLVKIWALLFNFWRLLGAAVGQPGRVIGLPHGHPQKAPKIKKEHPDFEKE